jgi:hypothetical protein
MSVLSTVVSTGPYAPNGTTKAFPFYFAALSADEIKVVRRSSAGVDTPLAGYSVVLNNGTGGTVTFGTAPAAGDSIYILSNPNFQQQDTFANQGNWSPTAINQALDHADIRSLYLLDQIFRSLRVIPGESLAALPNLAARQNMLLSFDNLGNPSVTNPTAILGTKGDPGGNTMAIGPFTSATGLSIPVGTDMVRTSGYSVAGTGSAFYFADAAVNSSYVSANPRTSFISANGRGFRLDRSFAVTPDQVGALGDGSTNDNAALQAWLDLGGRIFQPAKPYYSAAGLILRKHVDWDGVGFTEESLASGGYPNQPGSHINFGTGAGFTVQSSFIQTDIATVLANVNAYRVQEGASNSSIRNVAFVGANTGATVTGFYSRTTVHLENVWVVQFTGKGFDLSGSADAPDGNSEYGSVDRSTLVSTMAKLNGSHGYHLRGRDANVCKLIGPSAQQNGGWGILDESSFGNSYIEPHLATNIAGAIKAIAGASSSLFDNPYVEGGTGQNCEIGGANTIIGRDLTLNNTPPGQHPTMISSKRVSSANFEITDSQNPAAVTDRGVIFNDTGGNGLAIQGIGSGADVSFWNQHATLAAYLLSGTTNWQFVGNVSSGGVVNSIGGYNVGGTRIINVQQAPIANAANAVAAPTQAEFNALVSTVNSILAMARESTGHGLIFG